MQDRFTSSELLRGQKSSSPVKRDERLAPCTFRPRRGPRSGVPGFGRSRPARGSLARGPALGPRGVERPRTFAEPPHPRLHSHSATWLGMRPDFPKLQRSLGGRFRFVSKVCFLAA